MIRSMHFPDNVQNLSHFQDCRLPLNRGRIEAMSDDDGLKAMGQLIQIDEARIRDHLGEMVRGTVEETLNALLDAEADRLCGAGRYDAARAGRIPGPAATNVRCTPWPGK
jgi:hypothetical protein